MIDDPTSPEMQRNLGFEPFEGNPDELLFYDFVYQKMYEWLVVTIEGRKHGAESLSKNPDVHNIYSLLVRTITGNNDFFNFNSGSEVVEEFAVKMDRYLCRLAHQLARGHFDELRANFKNTGYIPFWESHGLTQKEIPF